MKLGPSEQRNPDHDPDQKTPKTVRLFFGYKPSLACIRGIASGSTSIWKTVCGHLQNTVHSAQLIVSYFHTKMQTATKTPKVGLEWLEIETHWTEYTTNSKPAPPGVGNSQRHPKRFH